MKIIGKAIPLESLTENSPLLLLEVAPYYTYVDGKRTDEIAGYRYTVIETKDYEKFGVKIPNTPAIITPEEISSAKQKLAVTFEEATAKIYQNQAGSLDISVTAKAIKILK